MKTLRSYSSFSQVELAELEVHESQTGNGEQLLMMSGKGGTGSILYLWFSTPADLYRFGQQVSALAVKQMDKAVAELSEVKA